MIIYKDDIEIVTEFPCLLGHPVCKEKKLSFLILLQKIETREVQGQKVVMSHEFYLHHLSSS